MEKIKVVLDLYTERYTNLMFDGKYTVKEASSFMELEAGKTLILKEIGHISASNFLRVHLNNNAIEVALLSNYRPIMEFRLFLDPINGAGDVWHLKRVYSALSEDLEIEVETDRLEIEFMEFNGRASISYSDGVLTIS